MAVYGLGCHPQNIIWIEARFTKISDMYINYSSFEMNFSKSLIFFIYKSYLNSLIYNIHVYIYILK
jgi:hypothetical protein